MGRDGGLSQSDHGSKRASHRTHISTEDDVDTDLNLQPSVRNGPMPQSPAIASTKLVTANIELTSQDEGDIAMRDQDAEKYGPLTKHRLETERKKTKFDPRFPRRPLRILSIGKVEENTSDFKDFRKHAHDNDITRAKGDNPK